MKKWCLFLSAYLMLCLLAACGAGAGEPVRGGVTEGSAVSAGPAQSARRPAHGAAQSSARPSPPAPAS